MRSSTRLKGLFKIYHTNFEEIEKKNHRKFPLAWFCLYGMFRIRGIFFNIPKCKKEGRTNKENIFPKVFLNIYRFKNNFHSHKKTHVSERVKQFHVFLMHDVEKLWTLHTGKKTLILTCKEKLSNFTSKWLKYCNWRLIIEIRLPKTDYDNPHCML